MKIWTWIKSIFVPDSVWEYGYCEASKDSKYYPRLEDPKARRNKLNGKVQFLSILGKQGPWTDMNKYWWPTFKTK